MSVDFDATESPLVNCLLHDLMNATPIALSMNKGKPNKAIAIPRHNSSSIGIRLSVIAVKWGKDNSLINSCGACPL
jgi:hypothetical protein